MINKIKNLFKSNILFAIIITSMSVFIALIFSGFRIFYPTSDDYLSALLLFEGCDVNPFLSYFLTFPLMYLQKIFADINLYIVFQCVLCFVAFIAIDYMFLERFGTKKGTVLALLVNCIYISTVLILVQFTHTTTVACVAGYLLLFMAYTKKKKSKRIIQIILAFIMVILGSWFRFDSFGVVTAVTGVFIACLFIVNVWREKNNKASLINAFVMAVKKYYKSILLFLLAALVTLGINSCSEALKLTSPGYASYKEYNTARSAAIDYDKAPYAGNEEFYNSLDIYSQNDLDCVSVWCVDYDFFNAVKLQQISDYSSKPEIGLRFSLNYLYSLIQKKASALTGMNPDMVIGAAVAVLLIVLILLYKFRNKIKYVFPLGLTAFWIMFFFIFKINQSNILCIPICVISVITSFFCNRYRYFVTATMNICVLALYTYLNFSRISFRATYTFLFTVFVLLLFSLSKGDFRAKFQQKDYKFKKVVITFVYMAAAATAVFSNLYIWNNIIYIPIGDQTNCELNEYVREHKDKTYVYDNLSQRRFLGNYDSPLNAPYILDNAVSFGFWFMGSPFYMEELEQHNIPHMFGDMIDNDEAAFIFFDNTVNGIGKMKDLVEVYYNNHYADDNERIVLAADKKLGEYVIYNVVTEKIK